jgi:hypothetical protein
LWTIRLFLFATCSEREYYDLSFLGQHIRQKLFLVVFECPCPVIEMRGVFARLEHRAFLLWTGSQDVKEARCQNWCGERNENGEDPELRGVKRRA